MTPNVCHLTPALKRYVQHQWRVIDVLFAKINTATSDELHELETAKNKLEYVMATGTVPEGDKDQLKPIITLKDAPNVFQEAWADGGIPADLNPDKFAERKIDLEQLIQTSIDAFNQAGLNEWVADIEKAKSNPEFQEKLANIEEDPTIRNYLMQGYEIIGIMPGKQAQLVQYEQALKELRATVITGGQTSTAQPGNIGWPQINDFINASADSSHQNLVFEVPDKPYLLLTKPTKKPPKETTNLTVNRQKQLFEEMTQQPAPPAPPNPKVDPNLKLMVMSEYSVTQSLFAKLTINDPYLKSKNQELQKYTPLDDKTVTRFVNFAPVSNSVPGAFWRGDRLRFGRSVVSNSSELAGVRFAVRVEL